MPTSEDDRDRRRGGAQAQPERVERARLAEARRAARPGSSRRRSRRPGSVRKVSATARHDAEQRPGTSRPASRRRARSPPSASASAQSPLRQPVDELLAPASGCFASVTTPARVGHLRLELGSGSSIAFSSPFGGVHVGHVDEARRRRRPGSACRRCPSRRARSSARSRGSPSPASGGSFGERLARVGADRHGLRADHDLRARLGEVVDRVDVGVLRHRQHELVGGELDRLARAGRRRGAGRAASCWRPRRRRPSRPARICAASSSEPANDSFTSAFSASSNSRRAGRERLGHRGRRPTPPAAARLAVEPPPPSSSPPQPARERERDAATSDAARASLAAARPSPTSP